MNKPVKNHRGREVKVTTKPKVIVLRGGFHIPEPEAPRTGLMVHPASLPFKRVNS